MLSGTTLAFVTSIDSSFFLHDSDIEMRMCGRNWVENFKKMVQDLVLSEQYP